MDKALLVCLSRALIFGSGFRTTRRDQIWWVSRVLMTIVVSVLLVQGVGTSQSTPSRKNTTTSVRQKNYGTWRLGYKSLLSLPQKTRTQPAEMARITRPVFPSPMWFCLSILTPPDSVCCAGRWNIWERVLRATW